MVKSSQLPLPVVYNVCVCDSKRASVTHRVNVCRLSFLVCLLFPAAFILGPKVSEKAPALTNVGFLLSIFSLSSPFAFLPTIFCLVPARLFLSSSAVVEVYSSLLLLSV